MLQWHPTGFDAYCGHEIDGQDNQALEHLAQYLAKGPVSLDKLDYADWTGTARYRSTKAHPRHGAFRDFDPLQFLADLTAHIARPYQRIVNYHGRFSNRSRGFRKKHLTASCPTDPEIHPEIPCAKTPSPRKASWARLIQRVYEVDPLVCPCGGRLRPIALIEDPEVIRRILDHCGLREPEPDPRTARAPPLELLYIPVDPDAL